MREENTVEKSLIAKIYLLLVLIAGVILVVCFFMTRYKKSDSEISIEVEPIQVETTDDSTIYTFDFSDYTEDFNCLEFFTSHLFVSAKINGEKVYSFEKDGGFWTSSPGTTYHFVPINNESDVVYVTVKAAYDEVKDENINFYIGDSREIYIEILRVSIAKFLASLMILIFSLALFIYCIYMRTKQPVTKDIQYLALFSLILGIWSINETDVMVLITKSKVLPGLVSYITLLLMVPAFILFFYNYLGMDDKYIHTILVGLSCLEFVIFSFLHFTKIYEYKQTLIFVQLTLLVGVSYMVLSVLYKLFRKRYTSRLMICVIGVVSSGVAVFADIYTYRFLRSYGDADTYGRFVYLIFIVVMGWGLMRETDELISKGRRAKQLEIFAITDSMTGMFNRNAYEMAINSIDCPEKMGVIVADLNDLKATNDNFGHDNGDLYIGEFAEIFTDILDKIGNCYRIGGDEFCCIIDNVEKMNMSYYIVPIRARMRAINLKRQYRFHMEAAIGFAAFDNSMDKKFEDTIKRADSYMYENKRQLKLQK